MTIKTLQAEFNTLRSARSASFSVSVKDKVAAHLAKNPGTSKSRANAAVRLAHNNLHKDYLAVLAKLVESGDALATVKSFTNTDHVAFRSLAVETAKSKASKAKKAKPRATRSKAKSKASKTSKTTAKK